MSELTTTDVSACVRDLERHLVSDAFSKQRPVQVFVKMWMSQMNAFDTSVEDMTEAVFHMMGERLSISANRRVPPVEYQAPVG